MYKEKKIIISIVCEGTEWQLYQDYRLFSFLFLKIIFLKGLMQIWKNILSEVGFEPTPSIEDQNTILSGSPDKLLAWVWRLRPLGHPDICIFWKDQFYISWSTPLYYCIYLIDSYWVIITGPSSLLWQILQFRLQIITNAKTIMLCK